MKPTRLDPIRLNANFSNNALAPDYEPYWPTMPAPRTPIRGIDAVEIATMQVFTPGWDWRPAINGELSWFAAHLASWDARGELRGLSAFAIAWKLQNLNWQQATRLRAPWLGLSILATLDADDRTGVQVLVDGAPRGGDDPLARRAEERLRSRLADADIVCGRSVAERGTR